MCVACKTNGKLAEKNAARVETQFAFSMLYDSYVCRVISRAK